MPKEVSPPMTDPQFNRTNEDTPTAGASARADASKKRHIGCLVIGAVALLALLLLLVLAVMAECNLYLYIDGEVKDNWLFASTTYTELTSPELDGRTHELVFVETAVFPFNGEGYVYEKVNSFLVCKLGDYYADDSTRPVHYGFYEIDWRDDGFTLRALGHTTDFSFALKE